MQVPGERPWVLSCRHMEPGPGVRYIAFADTAKTSHPNHDRMMGISGFMDVVRNMPQAHPKFRYLDLHCSK
jgi:hypothetical protein